MKNINELQKIIFKFCLTAVFAVISITAAQAQTSLRDALDFDGDDKADVSVVRPSNNTWFTLKSDGSGVSQRTFGSAVDDVPAPGDYDGDGKGDFCVWRQSNATFYYYLSSNGSFGERQWGIVGDEPVSRRWDTDAITDFAIARRSGTSLVWYVLGSVSNQMQVQTFGLASDIPIPGDYDGDGRFDAAVRRAADLNSQATIYINGSTAGFSARVWGLGGDFVVPGDYDGDGKTDLTAVRKESNNLVWYILNSGNGTFQIKTFGLEADDYLVPNDYDGDNKADIAVWRKTNGIFYIEKSSGGFQFTQWGANPDFPVAAYDTH